MSNSSWQFWNNKSIPLQILYHSSVSWEITPLYFFSSNNIYFVQKKPIKGKLFETFVCSGQNLSNSSCQFWNDKSIPLQILHNLLCQLLCTFLAQTIHTLLKWSTLRWTFLRLSGAWVKIRQFLMSILKRQVNCSSNFASFFNVMTHNSFVNFKLIPFLLWIKRPQQTPNFETFKYSGENLQYS